MNAPLLPHALRKPLPAEFLDALQEIFGERLSTADAVREHHGRDESPYPPMPPDAVVFAHSTDEVAALVGLCARHRVPLIPYGVGSSLEGHLLALQGGVSVGSVADESGARDQSGRPDGHCAGRRHSQAVESADSRHRFLFSDRSRRRRHDRRHDRHRRVGHERGALRHDARERSGADRRHGRRKNRAHRASREEIQRRVRPDADLRRQRRHARCDHRNHVRIYPQPEAVSAASCSFPTVEDAVQTTIATIQMGIPIARCELLDALTVKAVNARDKLGLPEMPLLLFEFHGSTASVAEQATAVEEIAREHGAAAFEWATRPEDRTRLWEARHNAYFACLQLKPGCRSFTTDVCVPISRLAECIAADGSRHRAIVPARTDTRPRRRRQFSLRHSGRHVEARRTGRSRAAEQADRYTRAGDGRYLHRRTRCRHAQDGVPARRARRRRARTDGTHQAVVRSTGYLESGKGRAYLIQTSVARSR